METERGNASGGGGGGGGNQENAFYLRYYVGHKGKFGHEFLEFEVEEKNNGSVRIRYANNSQYRDEEILRKEMSVSTSVKEEIMRIVEESEIMEENDERWPEPDRIGKQEFECVIGDTHVWFVTAKIGSLMDVQESRDPEGLRVFYYLVQVRHTTHIAATLSTQTHKHVHALSLSLSLCVCVCVCIHVWMMFSLRLSYARHTTWCKHVLTAINRVHACMYVCVCVCVSTGMDNRTGSQMYDPLSHLVALQGETYLALRHHLLRSSLERERERERQFASATATNRASRVCICTL